MARPKSLNPKVRLHITIEQSLKDRLSILLYSEVEQCIPQGAWQAFIEARIREWFDWKREDLAPYGFPPGYFVTGPAEMVQAVTERLKGSSQ